MGEVKQVVTSMVNNTYRIVYEYFNPVFLLKVYIL